MSDTPGNRTMRELLRILARRFWEILAIFAVVVAVAWIATALAPRWYRCEAELLATPSRSLSPLENPIPPAEQMAMFITTQRQIARSDYVICSALMRLEGVQAPRRTASEDSNGTPWYPEGDVEAFRRERYDWVHEVKENVEVLVPAGGDAQTFTVRVDWPEEPERADAAGEDPLVFAASRAHEFTVHLLDAYLLRQKQFEMDKARREEEFMTQTALAAAREDLDAADRAINAFIQDHAKGELRVIATLVPGRATGIEAGTASLATRFQGELNSQQVELQRVQTLLSAVEAQVAKGPEGRFAIPDAVTAANPNISKLQSDILDLALEVDRLEEIYEETYQELATARSQLAKARAELYEELRLQAERLGQQKQALEAQIAELQRIVTADKQKLDEWAPLAARYEQLIADRNAAQDRYDTLKSDAIAAQTARKLAQNPILVRVIDAPSFPEPEEPRRPILWLNLLIAAGAGVVLSLVYAFAAETMDHSLKDVEHAERYLGTAVLASVPKVRGRLVRGRGEDLRVARTAEESCRALWTAIYASPACRGPQVVFCSATHLEGTTSLLAATALSGSRHAAGRTVMVDLNFRRPRLAKALGLEPAAGAAEVLAGQQPLEQAVQPINDRLDALTAGEEIREAAESLEGEALTKLLGELASRYAHVLIDVPPVNTGPEAALIARIAGQAALIARSGRTPREALAQAQRSLDRSGAAVLGVVLNLRTYPLPGFVYRRV